MFCDKLNAWFCLLFSAFGNGIVAYQSFFFFFLANKSSYAHKIVLEVDLFKATIERCWWWKVQILFGCRFATKKSDSSPKLASAAFKIYQKHKYSESEYQS